ncbi:uncharacterized protein [Musca autumnalis]|uniref:uncharacterized protein n=1 Tax=Musca autumnalis TaxID=221902 RepID=UPI003CE6F32C
MKCELCLCPLRGTTTKSYHIYEELVDDKHRLRLVDVIEKYLQMEVKPNGYQSTLLCQSCYTHLDDFHKFALLIKERQESLTNVNIPIIKLESSSDEEDIEQDDNGYIRDSDVVVEFNTDDTEKHNGSGTFRQFGDDELLMPINGFQSNTNNYNNYPSFGQISLAPGDALNFRTKIASRVTLPPVRKTPYKTHSPEDRSRIVEAANRGDDWSVLASELGVKYKTAYTWVSTSRKEMFLKSGKISFTEDQIKTIIQWIEDNRQLTLKEVVAKIKNHFKKDVCVYFVECTLEGRLYQHQRPHDYLPHLMNTLENKTKRSEYVKTLEYYTMENNKTIIWLGETVFKMFCRRAKGRFTTNSSFFATCDPTLYMMGAITQEGVIGFKRSRERLRPEEIIRNWLETTKFDVTNLVIVCDSDRCFSELDEYFNNSEVTLLLLSPYSYMLNPMESIWHSIKERVKSPSNVLHYNPNDMKNQRLIFAEQCIDDLLPTITKEDCIKAIEKVKKCHNDILDMQDMPV